MNTFKNTVFLIILGFLLSCSHSEERHLGQWELLHNKDIGGIMEISEDIVSFYRYEETECDTSILLLKEFQRESIETDGQVIKINSNSKEGRLEILFTYKDSLSGEICFKGVNDDCGDFRKSNHDLKGKTKKANDEIYNYRNSIADEIYTIQNELDILTKDVKLSDKALALNSYVDSLTTLLLNEYNLDYNSINCWENIDSLLSEQKAVNFLFGQNTRPPNKEFNAHKLEDRLTNYLEIKNNVFDVGVVFPKYNKTYFDVKTKSGLRTTWCIYKLYRKTLGEIIVELISIKVKVVQIEKITNLE